jgi:hypothetical protein
MWRFGRYEAADDAGLCRDRVGLDVCDRGPVTGSLDNAFANAFLASGATAKRICADLRRRLQLRPGVQERQRRPEFICKARTSEPQRFTISLLPKVPALNI